MEPFIVNISQYDTDFVVNTLEINFEKLLHTYTWISSKPNLLPQNAVDRIFQTILPDHISLLQ